MICLVCNGMASFDALCSACGGKLDDGGRVYDYYCDYSPYRPIDDSKLTNGIPDLQNHLCLHVGWCPACGRKQMLALQEQPDLS